MELGLVGKTNTGKSSFFKAATMIEVDISNRIFCTIKPNVGVSYVTSACPCSDFKLKCTPRNSQCVNGTRMIPVKLWDIAGLIPGAHEGRGLGNQFLNDIIQSDMLIHVIDASGTTDAEGQPTEGYDPANDVRFLEEEIDLWFASVIDRNIGKLKDRDDKKVSEVLAGLGIKENHIREVLEKFGLGDIKEFAKELRKISKPMIIAANKMDLPRSQGNIEKLKKEFPHLKIIPCSAEAEIALRTASKAGFIDYIPGSRDFAIKKELTENQRKALELIKSSILSKYGSTGVQECLNKAVFEFMGYMAVYPVENEHKFSNKKGEILPDVFLMPPESTALDLAYRIHTDIGKRFIGAIDAKTKKRVSAEYLLKNGDIISIQSAAK
ncbi:MAG: redox-regulated ATPase YchF [Candidatus Aenigmatarchaeota archaeon]